MAEPFTFYSETGIVRWTGFKADSLSSLLSGLKKVTGSCIFYHLHRSLFQRHFTTSDYMNDFARWIYVVLQQDVLSERLASIDPLDFVSIRAARKAIIKRIEPYIGQMEVFQRVPAGREFFFCEQVSFVQPTGITACDLREFHKGLKRVGRGSIFFHLLEARLRLGKKTNDFSEWLSTALNETGLARKIDQLSPYSYDLFGIQEELIRMVAERVRAVQ